MEVPIGGSGEESQFGFIPQLDMLVGMADPVPTNRKKKSKKVLGPSMSHLDGIPISESKKVFLPEPVLLGADQQISFSNKVRAMTPGESPLSPFKFSMPESSADSADGDYMRQRAMAIEGLKPQFKPFQAQASPDDPEELLQDIDEIIKDDTKQKAPQYDDGGIFDMSGFQEIRQKKVVEEQDNDDVIFVKEEPCPELGINMREVSEDQDISSYNVQMRSEVNIKDQLLELISLQEKYKLWDIKRREPSQHYKPGRVVYGTSQACEELTNSALVPSQTEGVIVADYLRPSLDGQYSENQQFTKTQVIGSGSYGEVHLCKDNTTQKDFVSKKINRKYKKTEVEILLKLNHVNITKLFGLIHRQGEPEIYMENCGRSLLHFAVLPDTEKLLTENRIWNLMKQGLKALAYLAIHQIIHFDIKPENICIQTNGSEYVVKITDFGSARVPQEAISFEGWTAEYMSPEACHMFLESRFPNLNLPTLEGDSTVSCQTDMFSWGMTIQFMIRKLHVLIPLITNGKNSYKGLNETEVAQMRLRMIMWMASAPHHVRQCMIPDVEDQHLKEMLQGMLEGCPEKRFTPANALRRMEEIESSTMLYVEDALSPLPSDQSIASATSETSLIKCSRVIRRRTSSMSSNGSVPSYTDYPASPLSHTLQPRRAGYKRRSSVKKRLRERISCPYGNRSEIECITPSTPLEGGNVPNFGAMFD